MSVVNRDNLATRSHVSRAPSVAMPSVDVRWLAVAILPLAAIYLLLLNPYWVPSGDGDVYTAMARSLVRGEGLAYNGASKVAITPPGWPLVLAGAMAVLPEFWFLKLITIGCMLGTMVLCFFILRRFASDAQCAAAVLLAGTLSCVYPLTYWMHTEALFCLLASAATLIAFRIGERRSGWPGAVLMLLLLAASCFTRWPGVLSIILIVPALLRGPLLQLDARRWITALLVVTTGIGTFLGTHRYLSLTPEQRQQANISGAIEESEDEPRASAAPVSPLTTHPTIEGFDPSTQTALDPTDTQPSTAPIATEPDIDEARPPSFFNPTTTSDSRSDVVSEYVQRFLAAGTWYSSALWQPLRVGRSIAIIGMVAQVVGWVCVALVTIAAVTALRERQWFWAGLLIYTVGLCVIWPNPNPRYYVPVAPFLIMALLLGLGSLRRWTAHLPGIRTLLSTGGIALLGSIVLTNIAVLTVDVSVFRSGAAFYDRYEAGLSRELIDISAHLRDDPDVHLIAVSDQYVNLGRSRRSKFGVRALHLLLDRIVVPSKYNDVNSRRGRDKLIDWANEHTPVVSHYIYQKPSEPWRVWHFRLPAEIQEKLSGRKPTSRSLGWRLFIVRHNRLVQVGVEPTSQRLPTRVPGL